MARELVWLENSGFAACGCTKFEWIVPSPGPTSSGRPPATVKEAFDRHDCTEFLLQARQERVKRRSQ